MDRSSLPDAAFVDPNGGNIEAVRDLAEGVLDQLLTQLETADDRSPLPGKSIAPSAAIPESPQSSDNLLDDLETIVAGSMNPAHPG